MTDEDRLRAHTPVLLADSADRYLNSPVVIHGCITGRWLQYWIAWAGDPDHPGIDWEMVMVREENGVLVEAVYAQHRTAQRRSARMARMEGARPVVFAGRNKHSSRFRAGWYRHGWHLERANGKRRLDAPLVTGVPDAVRGRVSHRDPDRWLDGLKV